ncbi:hypothetical protein NPIL_373581 [Nephila pilipes]|uniref:Uncharacterized protein n=1 Tax=Nephila pilipes TaxID=299642 RepID=A0A8X6R058_NEPPI|nr:hypothetical protein NPIL_373581 [Nephila pilipes]
MNDLSNSEYASSMTLVEIPGRDPRPRTDYRKLNEVQMFQETRAEVKQLLSTYNPKKTKIANMVLDITLVDDELIFHKPRRLPFAERDIVDSQVKEWI